MLGLALALAGCGGKNDDVQRAVDSFNAGNGPILLREFVEQRGAVSSCRLAPHLSYHGQTDLTVITTTGYWLQATIDANQTEGGIATTEGGSLDPKREAELSSRGKACTVSRANGGLALAG